MIPSLEALALTAILGLSDRPAEERPELELVAADVALAVEFGRVPFLGPAAREAAALALVAIAITTVWGWRARTIEAKPAFRIAAPELARLPVRLALVERL